MREPHDWVLADMIQARAERRPDHPVLTFEHLSLDGGATPDEIRTYAELAIHANRIAVALVERGIRRGDRFGVMMRNHPEFVEALIAASQCAGVLVPIDPRTRGEKLAYLLRDSGCRGLLCADYCLAAVLPVRDQLRAPGFLLVLETGEEPDAPDAGAVPGSESLRAILERPVATLDCRLESPGDPHEILYTSGTTGDPKGVVCPNTRFGSYSVVASLLGYQVDERPYTGLSLTHGNAQAATLGPCLALGLHGIFSRRFTKRRLWDVCRAHGATTFSVLGGMATAIYSEPRRDDDADNPVRVVTSGGMPAAIWTAFAERFGVAILEWYGATEGGLAIHRPGEGPVGSFGKAPPFVEMAILDEHDRPCPPFVRGEICSRPAGSSAAPVAYHGDPSASAAKVVRGWLRSGDIGHTDADGWLFFDHRHGSGIRRNGEFVNAGFVERVLAEHPDVADVFVYGVAAASGAPGEKDVVAAIVPVDRRRFDATSVFAACRRGLEPNCVPSHLQLVDEIPKTASEKPQPHLLASRFRPGAEDVFSEAPRSREPAPTGRASSPAPDPNSRFAS